MRSEKIERKMRIRWHIFHHRSHFIILVVVEIQDFTNRVFAAEIFVRHSFRQNQGIWSRQGTF